MGKRTATRLRPEEELFTHKAGRDPRDMKKFFAGLNQYWKDRPFIWNERDDVYRGKIPIPTSGRVLILGPHPDDPESVAITARLLMRSGCEIWVAIISLSPAGVEDEYARRGSRRDFSSFAAGKGEIRRREQIYSAKRFGLNPDKLVFLGMEEDSTLDSSQNRSSVKDQLKSVAPDLVILPMGKDPNRTHSWTYRVFREYAQDLVSQTSHPLIALYNEDPKTVEIRKDLFVFFGEESAKWKRDLLRIHDSQQQRNIHSRGMGFDDRILSLNYSSGRHLSAIPSAGAYAEVFEVELFDFPMPNMF